MRGTICFAERDSETEVRFNSLSAPGDPPPHPNPLRPRGRRGSLSALALLASLAACSGELGDPFARPGTWAPEAVNDRNLRVMVANPADLTAGKGSLLSSGQLAAIAVSRLRTDTVKPLPDSAVAEVVPVASGGSPQGGGAPPAAQGAVPQ